MVKTFNLTTEVPPDHKVCITLPSDFPVGPTEMVLVVVTRAKNSTKTLGDLAQSEFCGMWKDRSDIQDSVEFAESLRGTAWKRPA
ncbi:MAG: hypothetical protein PHT33_09645 [bacterium]|nr:hypothetical protein [bacterium]